MAYKETNGEPSLQFEQDHEDAAATLKKRSKSVAAGTTAPENVNNGCLDCNICLDSVHDPVVTLCGHLYCWPCIYKWLHVGTTSFESDEEPKCPVCKANISQALLVPLYGRGVTSTESDVKRPRLDVIPRRPPALELDAMVTAAATSRHNQPHPHPHLLHYQQPPPPHLPPHSVGSFGGMVLSRMFLSSDTSLFAYPSSQNTYPLMGYGGSPTMRRQDMLVAKSLNRVTIFLLCCVMLCLLLF